MKNRSELAARVVAATASTAEMARELAAEVAHEHEHHEATVARLTAELDSARAQAETATREATEAIARSRANSERSRAEAQAAIQWAATERESERRLWQDRAAELEAVVARRAAEVAERDAALIALTTRLEEEQAASLARQEALASQFGASLARSAALVAEAQRERALAVARSYGPLPPASVDPAEAKAALEAVQTAQAARSKAEAELARRTDLMRTMAQTIERANGERRELSAKLEAALARAAALTAELDRREAEHGAVLETVEARIEATAKLSRGAVDVRHELQAQLAAERDGRAALARQVEELTGRLEELSDAHQKLGAWLADVEREAAAVERERARLAAELAARDLGSREDAA